MCASLIINWSFPNSFQITKLQKDHIASAGVAIGKLFKNPDVETVELIHEVRQSYKSKWTSYSRFILEYVAFLTYCGSYPSTAAWVHFSYLYLFRLASWWKASWSSGTSQFWCEQGSGGNSGILVHLKTSGDITGALVFVRCHCSPWGRCATLPASNNIYQWHLHLSLDVFILFLIMCLIIVLLYHHLPLFAFMHTSKTLVPIVSGHSFMHLGSRACPLEGSCQHSYYVLVHQ